MAEVLSVYDPAASSVDGLMTLAPNNVAWAANDPVEQPHFYPGTGRRRHGVRRPVRAPPDHPDHRAGLQYQQNNGPGLVGWTIQNAAPTSNYLGYGGTHGYPDAAYESTGIWRRTMNLTAGEQAVFTIHCNLHGCGNWNSPYNLFELQLHRRRRHGRLLACHQRALSDHARHRYIFTPQSFTAGTINVGSLNATTINGASGLATLDANGRILPGGSLYGGVLGNDSSGLALGPAMFSQGYQVGTWQQQNSGQYAGLNLGYPGSGAYGSFVKFFGGTNGCSWGSINFDGGDGAIVKNAGGCNNPMASLMLGANGTTVDFEPDRHMKMHSDGGNSSYSPQLSFTGGAGASNCGTGAAFDPGSNDGAGRIVVGSAPPSVCRITWQRAYAQVAGGSPQTGGWANSAPVCSVSNEGHRAGATITFNANPNPGDTITIEGQTWRFWTSMVNANDTVIGANAAATALAFFQFQLVQFDAPNPGNAPGVDPPASHYAYAMPTSNSIALTYLYMDGVTGNSAALSTSNPAAISLPATLSGGTLPPTRTVVAQSGIGGMAISATGGSLAPGDVLAYSCIAYW